MEETEAGRAAQCDVAYNKRAATDASLTATSKPYGKYTLQMTSG